MHALWMVLAALLFASMGVCVKLGSAYFHPAEMIFWRASSAARLRMRKN